MKDYFVSVLGIVTGGGTWMLLRDVGIAVGVAFLTGYAAYWGGQVARKQHERKQNKSQKNANSNK
ncbi:MAG: hypothetical protein PHE56_04065 [Bacteroidales bacterium]|nr:hypothetical protein [Bacteroidales bacterium]